MSVSARIIIAIYVPFIHFTYSLHLCSLYFVCFFLFFFDNSTMFLLTFDL